MPSSHKKGGGASVPKFTSFKPKGPDIIQPVAETNINRPQPFDHHITQLGDSKVHRRIPVGGDATLNTSPRPSRTSQQPADRKLDGDVSYSIDRSGDTLILRYGSNDRSRVPRYRRIGAGRILGADGFMKIENLGSREEFFIRNHYESGALLSSDKKNLQARGMRTDSRPVRIRHAASDAGDATEDYLSFRTSRKRKRDGSTPEESSADEGPSYRSIHGKSRQHQYSDSSEADDGDASEDVSNRGMGDPMTMRSVELSRKVRECPEDVESWLELVDHQNALLDVQSGARAPTAAEIKSFADIKLSLLEQALSHNKDDGLRERLNFKIIEEGLKVWEFKVASKRLAEMVRNYPNSFKLWKLHISFLQSTLSACRYDEIKRLYTEKLQSLRKIFLDLSTPADLIECSEQIIYVFLRLTCFLADTGFAELASAAWQASLELNLARPSTLPQKEWEVPSSFQEYWESEVPRLGEDNWRGWASFAAGDAAQEPSDPKAADRSVLPTTRDGYKAWHAVEQQRARNATIPARTLDEGAEDDPFRVVMFADFQNILLYFPADIVPQLRSQLLDAFLVFYRLPPCSHNDNIVNAAVRDPFLVRSVQDIPFTQLSSRHSVGWPEGQQNKLPEFSYGIQHMSLTPENLFPSKSWFRYLGQIRDKAPPDHYQWVATTLKQLTQVIGIGELGPYTLAFESINEPGSEKKRAKALLKQDPSNVDIYLGYSILEGERDNKAAARNVLSAALGLPSITAHDQIRLGIGAMWRELDDGHLAKAVLQLCQFIEHRPKPGSAQTPQASEPTPSQILKTKQFLVTNRDYKISSGNVSEALIYAEGLVLLDYLTERSEKESSSAKQGDIWSAIVRITQCSEDLVSRGQQHSPSHEKFLQSSARLLYYHASHG
ncbi:DUF1740-domain-containing protein [Nemania sp. NC0429]|nr:DUF1740-domain-containing protein [Nemania sp. NC0429]